MFANMQCHEHFTLSKLKLKLCSSAMSKCWIVMGCVQLHFSVVVCTFDNRLSCTLHNVLFVQYLFTFQPNKLRHTLKINRHFTPHNIALCLLQELELQTCVLIGYRAIVLYKEHIVLYCSPLIAPMNNRKIISLGD